MDEVPQVRHRKRPCAECPWRVDTKPGQFEACRYERLANTSGRPGAEAPFGAPLFACHKTPDGAEAACAGWLAAVGRDNITVRVLLAQRRLPPEVLTPGEDWPALHADYDDMRAAKELRAASDARLPKKNPQAGIR